MSERINKFKKIFKSKSLLIILVSILLVLTVAGATYAWFTWRGEEETSLTMSIGDIVQVSFDNGPDIDIDNLSPVYNYIDGANTSIEILNKKDKTNILYSILLDIDTLPTQLQDESFKYVLVSDDTIVASGNFSSYSSGDEITIIDAMPLGLSTTYYDFYIYIDGNMYNSSDMMGKSFSGSLTVTVTDEIQYTPLSDFEYAIDTFDYYGDDIAIPDNGVLLIKYIGEDTVVNVPNTYEFDGATYDTYIYGNGADVESTFAYNEDITKVTFSDSINFADLSNEEYFVLGSAVDTFAGCSSLTEAPVIPNSVTSMATTFAGCTSLTEAPVIPSSVTNMAYTFSNCSSLTEAPVIPNSVTNMNSTFYGCSSLTKAPVIPNSVTNMSGTFGGCSSLTDAPVIPNSVTNMYSTFKGCTSLTGTIRIESSNVSSSWDRRADWHPFYNAGTVTVEVPIGSTTYNSLNTYKPSNITLVTY